MIVEELIQARKSKNIGRYLLGNYHTYLEELKELDYKIDNITDNNYMPSSYISPLANLGNKVQGGKKTQDLIIQKEYMQEKGKEKLETQRNELKRLIALLDRCIELSSLNSWCQLLKDTYINRTIIEDIKKDNLKYALNDFNINLINTCNASNELAISLIFKEKLNNEPKYKPINNKRPEQIKEEEEKQARFNDKLEQDLLSIL
ncbi:hypothetical protein [Streptobacillus moniliformis]|uniref:hypothetical protein n=1 Tax=Streptobacillus moniliformis TaxID=34105 RepID=UPI0007E4B313|nr:hypothetical protein [Streptobacillus moniliformis]